MRWRRRSMADGCRLHEAAEMATLAPSLRSEGAAGALRVRTAQRTLHAERVLLCPGAELGGVGGERLAPHGLRLTRLQMLRVRAQPGFALDAPLMTDLSLVRYGYHSGRLIVCT